MSAAKKADDVARAPAAVGDVVESPLFPSPAPPPSLPAAVAAVPPSPIASPGSHVPPIVANDGEVIDFDFEEDDPVLRAEAEASSSSSSGGGRGAGSVFPPDNPAGVDASSNPDAAAPPGGKGGRGDGGDVGDDDDGSDFGAAASTASLSPEAREEEFGLLGSVEGGIRDDSRRRIKEQNAIDRALSNWSEDSDDDGDEGGGGGGGDGERGGGAVSAAATATSLGDSGAAVGVARPALYFDAAGMAAMTTTTTDRAVVTTTARIVPDAILSSSKGGGRGDESGVGGGAGNDPAVTMTTTTTKASTPTIRFPNDEDEALLLRRIEDVVRKAVRDATGRSSSAGDGGAEASAEGTTAATSSATTTKKKSGPGSAVLYVWRPSDDDDDEPSRKRKRSDSNGSGGGPPTGPIKKLSRFSKLSPRCFVEAKKRLPKCVAGLVHRPIFTAAIVHERIEAPILAAAQDLPPTLPMTSEFPLLKVTYIDDPTDPLRSIVLIVRGRKDLVDLVPSKATDIVRSAAMSHNVDAILRDGSSLEIDVRFDLLDDDDDDEGDVCHHLGATLQRPSSSDRGTDDGNGRDDSGADNHHNGAGLWIRDVVGDGPMDSNIGRKAIESGAVLLKADGNVVRSVDEVERAFSEARRRHRQRGEGDASIVVTLCVAGDADLGDADGSSVVGTPRRRDGALYRGKFKFGGKDRDRAGKESTARRPSAAAAASSSAGKGKVDAHVPRRPRADSSSSSSSSSGKKEGALSGTAAAAARGLESSGGVAAAADAPKKKKDQPAGLSHYLEFVKKYESVKDIEYGNSGINKHLVNKPMWEAHKKIYGDRCVDDCPCPSDLGRLTAHVVSDFVAGAKKKDREWSNPNGLRPGENPVGFVDRFAPKFYDRVKREFPNDKPKDVLAKLASMWTEHRKIMRYGLKCRKDCPCGEGWDHFQKKCLLRPPPAATGSGASREAKDKRPSSAGKPATATTTTGRGPSSLPTKGIGGANKAPAPPASSSFSVAHGPPPPRAAAAAPGAKAAAASSKKTTSTSSQPRGKEYALTFDPYAPLGFHCVTGSIGTRSVCKVTSVSPQGKAKDKDGRLQPGTIVVATSLVGVGSVPLGGRTPVGDHKELKRRYEAAKMRGGGSKIRLWFNNVEVVGSSASAAARAKQAAAIAASEEFWTSSGAWRGPSSAQGWPGGAAVLQRPTPPPPSDRQQQQQQKQRESSLSGPTPPRPSPSEGSVAESSAVNPSGAPPASKAPPTAPAARRSSETSAAPPLRKPGLVSRAASAPAAVGGTAVGESGPIPGPSLLRRSTNGELIGGGGVGGRKSGGKRRSVVFAKRLVETKLYDPKVYGIDDGSLSDVGTERKGGGGESSSAATAPPAAAATPPLPIEPTTRDEPEAPTEEQVLAAVRRGSHKELIRLLKLGADVAHRDSDGMRPYDHVKEILAGFDRDLRDPGLSKHAVHDAIREAKHKRTVLKIYTHAAHLIDMARFMKKWVKAELTVRRGENVALTPLGMQHPSSDFLFVTMELDHAQQQANTPFVPFTSSPNWAGNPSNPKYHAKYNGELSYSLARNVVVRLVKGNSTTAGSNVTLGYWRDTFETIKEHVDAIGDKEIRGVLQTTEFLESGSIVVGVRRVPVDKEFLTRKRAEIARELSNLTDWIETFQQETSGRSHGRADLNANISLRKCGGMSILHAAIYVADLNLVNRLLSLGADPNAKSDVGSAINLAVSLADKSADSISSQETHGTLTDIVHSLNQHAARHTEASQRANNLSLSQSVGNQEASATAHDQMLGGGDSRWDVVPPRQGQLPQEPLGHPSEQAQVQQYHRKDPRAIQDPRAIHELADEVQSILNSQYQPQTLQAAYSGPGDNGMQLFNAPTDPRRFSSAHSGYHEPVDPSVLPLAFPVDWLEGKSERCKLFNQANGCWQGAHCREAHVHAPVGLMLDDPKWIRQYLAGSAQQWLPSEAIHTKSDLGSNGKMFFTAAYVNQIDNSIYYAERGERGYQSRQGIYWYPSESDAIEAVRRVAAANGLTAPTSGQGHESTSGLTSQNLPGSNWCPPKSRGIPATHRTGSLPSGDVNSSKRSLPSAPVEPTRKKAKVGEDGVATNSIVLDEPYLFRKLKGSNLSNIYNQIFWHPMRKTRWSPESKGGRVTTSFRSELQSDGYALYLPSGHGGVFQDGKWWYEDDKSARASTFLKILKRAVADGFLGEDLRNKNGKELKFI